MGFHLTSSLTSIWFFRSSDILKRAERRISIASGERERTKGSRHWTAVANSICSNVWFLCLFILSSRTKDGQLDTYALFVTLDRIASTDIKREYSAPGCLFKRKRRKIDRRKNEFHSDRFLFSTHFQRKWFPSLHTVQKDQVENVIEWCVLDICLCLDVHLRTISTTIFVDQVHSVLQRENAKDVRNVNNHSCRWWFSMPDAKKTTDVLKSSIDERWIVHNKMFPMLNSRFDWTMIQLDDHNQEDRESDDSSSFFEHRFHNSNVKIPPMHWRNVDRDLDELCWWTTTNDEEYFDCVLQVDHGRRWWSRADDQNDRWCMWNRRDILDSSWIEQWVSDRCQDDWRMNEDTHLSMFDWQIDRAWFPTSTVHPRRKYLNRRQFYWFDRVRDPTTKDQFHRVDHCVRSRHCDDWQVIRSPNVSMEKISPLKREDQRWRVGEQIHRTQKNEQNDGDDQRSSHSHGKCGIEKFWPVQHHERRWKKIKDTWSNLREILIRDRLFLCRGGCLSWPLSLSLSSYLCSLTVSDESSSHVVPWSSSSQLKKIRFLSQMKFIRYSRKQWRWLEAEKFSCEGISNDQMSFLYADQIPENDPRFDEGGRGLFAVGIIARFSVISYIVRWYSSR